MIRFKDGAGGPMSRRFADIHPDLRMLLQEFDKYSGLAELPDPVVTDLIRDASEQCRVYLRYWKKLQDALEPTEHHLQIDPEGDGTWRPLSDKELQEAHALAGLSEEALAEKAGAKFSWHQVGCAADLRTFHYDKGQLGRAKLWFAQKTVAYPGAPQKWEMIYHDTTGRHLHCARRDDTWRRLFPFTEEKA